MYLTHLSLTNFRNYTRLSFDLPQQVIILQGANAQGKTNVLEAIYYLTAAKSPYASSDSQLVNWLADRDDLPHARVDAELVRQETRTRLEIILTASSGAQSRYRKYVRINGSPKRAMDLLGLANVVLFVPQDISLVDGPPSGRRRYLDAALCQVDIHYCRSLKQYNRVLEQRNSLLRQLRDRGGATDQLAFWDDRLTRAGAEIIACRQQVVVDLEAYAQPIHRDLSGGQERLRLRYVPSFDPNGAPQTNQDLLPGLELPPAISIPQEPSAVRERFSRELRTMRAQEIQRGMTLIGPHRDDLRFLNGQVDLQVYGSRGQQRTAVLAIKLAEVNLMHQRTGEQPILLLDEVMSELDPARRRYLCDQLCQVEQSLVTTTDLDALTPDILAQATMFRVSQGHLEQIQPGS